jgi:predicted nuclease of predicted toxin-antitoxin system
VFSAAELGYRGRSDEHHLAKASQLEAVVLTHDVDFLVIASAPGMRHRGILFAQAKNVSIGDCIRGVELIVKVLSERDMKDHIEFL